MLAMRVICLSCLALLLAATGCVSPRTRAPVPDGAVAPVERRAALAAAVETALARRARVYDLAWPVLASNTDLCPETRKSVGLTLADLETRAAMSGGVGKARLQELGWEEGVTVVHPWAGAPAAVAGVRPGTRLVAVQGEETRSLSQAGRAISHALKEEGEVTVTFDEARGTGGVLRTLTLAGAEVCDMPVKISPSQQLNAVAAGGEIVIYTGLIRALEDPVLQFVIAHEAAHLAERHVARYLRNAAVTSVIVTGPPLILAAGLTDGVLSIVGITPDISVQQRMTAALLPWAKHFEAEADYVGMYMFARAGGDLGVVRQAFDLFSAEHPKSIYAPSTHPLTPDRVAAALATADEIAAKQAAGAPLTPEVRR